MVLEKILESPLDCKEIKPVNLKGNQPWIFIGRTDDEVEASILWPPDVKNWLIWKDSDARTDWEQEEKGTTENQMAGWHHRLNVHEFGWTPGVGDGQGALVCCSPWVAKSRTWLSYWTELKIMGASENPSLVYCFWKSTDFCLFFVKLLSRILPFLLFCIMSSTA